MKEQMNIAKDKMEKTLKVLGSEFAAIRAGRANPAVLDRITVEYYGAQTPINQIAAVSVSEARVLVIQPWDKGALKAIEKAIQASDLGINPQNDGSVIRLTFPQLTEERRKEIVKEIKKLGEDSKVAVRSIRRDCMDKFKEMKITKQKANLVKCLLIKESPVSIECKVKQEIDLGSHTMFMAEVLCIDADEKYIDEKGAFDISKCKLIAYANGGYYTLGKKVGKFGFSVKKKKRK